MKTKKQENHFVTISVPGKVILMGEHAVVYGKPGLLAAIDKRCQVKITLRGDKKVKIISKQLTDSIYSEIRELATFTQEARKLWQTYTEKQDIETLKKITPNSLDLIKLAIVETFAHYRKQLNTGFEIIIDSQIPLGSGLGSSAAVIAGVVAGLTKLLSVTYDLPTINEITYTVEKYQHGNASGVDPATVCFGGLIWYRKESPVYKVISTVSIALPGDFLKGIYLIDTGKPQESTGEMVHFVQTLEESKKNYFLSKQEQVTRELLEAFAHDDIKNIKQLIKQGEQHLEEIGVVSPQVTKMIRSIEKAAAAAKICGGGGKTKGTGIVLAYSQDKKVIEEVCKEFGYSYFQTKLGVEGLGVIS